MCEADREATRRAWLDKVESIREVLVTNVDASEDQATLAMPAVDALREARFFRLKMPAEFGGAEADPVLQLEVLEALSYVHPASGWCTMVGATSTGVPAAYLSEAGIEQVFGQEPHPIMASSFFPAGTAVPEDGGYRVNGRWRFASGIHHADWVGAGAIVIRNGASNPAPEGAPPEVINVIVPKSDIEIHENWKVMGLKGTGSCDFSIDHHFVPEVLTFPQNFMAPKPRRGGPIFRLGFPAFVAVEHIAFALGVARRALDELVTMATTRRGQFRPAALSERHVVHRLVGMYDLKLRAARALALQLHEEIWRRLCGDEPVGPGLHAQSRSLATYTTELAVEIATQAFRYGGGGALFQPNIFELLLRDINAAAQHILPTDAAYEDYGKELMGLTDATTEKP